MSAEAAVAAILAAIAGNPTSVESIEVAAEMAARGYDPEAIAELLGDSADVILADHPELDVTAPTLTAMLATLMAARRALTEAPAGVLLN